MRRSRPPTTGSATGAPSRPEARDRARGAQLASAGFFEDLTPAEDRPLGMGIAGVALLAGIIGLSSGWFGAPPQGSAAVAEEATPFRTSALH